MILNEEVFDFSAAKLSM